MSAASGLLFSSACAFTPVPLPLPTQGLEEKVGDAEGRRVVVAIPFSDERTLRDRCGMKKNGYNMDTADAVCQDDPAAWIGTLLAEELRASGFSVLESDSAHDRGTLRIEGALLKLFVEPVIGGWSGSLEADLSVRLHASTASGLRAQRTFFVKGWKGGVMAATDQPYQTAVHRATQEVLEQMVRAIFELVERYPEIGRSGASGPALVLQKETTR